MNKKKKFVADGVFQAELHSFFLRALNTAVFYHSSYFLRATLVSRLELPPSRPKFLSKLPKPWKSTDSRGEELENSHLLSRRDSITPKVKLDFIFYN